MKILELRNINKKFKLKKGKELQVLKDLNLSVEKNEKIAIIGQSGTGKSTIMNVLGTLLIPDSGHMVFNGESINIQSKKERINYRMNTLGYIFQDFKLIEDLSVEKNILLGIRAKYKLSKKEECQLVEESLKQLNLLEKKNIKVKYLSGGEKQRVSISRALGKNPEIILADEPTGSLDYDSANKIIDELLELDKTVICVTHDYNIAKKFQRLYRLNEGVLEDVNKESLEI